jgi:nuclear GTP-binding protein
VLKGVVRVEALPTPSDHIQELMARVKPLYLSRTYGVPLPDKEDPTQSWEPEVFLDKLARMKGRLQKGGEPDIEGVAKIVLSDWVRGRVPFFVTPPERPEELNKAEAKGKGRAVEVAQEDRVVVGVKQKLGSIMQKNTFLPEDIQRMDEEEAEGSTSEHSDGDGDGDDNEKEEVQEDNLSWTDVFAESPEDIPVGKSAIDEGKLAFQGETAN